MNYVGKKVKHNRWGEGLIVSDSGSNVEVLFPFKDKPIQFSAPSCFEKFLQLMDADAINAAQKDLEKLNQENRRKKEEHDRQFVLRQIEHRQQSSNTEKSIKIEQYTSVETFVQDQERALTAEIMYLKTHGGKRIRILNGVLVDQKKGLYIYSFESESELNYPDGTQITLWHGVSSIAATLLGCEDLIVYIASEENLGNEVPSIEFSAEPWRLLNFLNQRLKALQEQPSAIVKALILDGVKKVQNGKSIIKGQDEACKMASNQPITFIWGPPGTGKTYTLAKIALEHIAKHKRVLMLSYSNVSVDGAALRVLEMDKKPNPGKIVRYGYPRNKELLSHPYLSSYNLTISRHPDLLAERNRLMAEKKRLTRSDKRMLEINDRLKKIRGQLTSEEENSVRKASFVATTVSKAIADKVLYESKYDVVIFDEASMAYIPQIVFAASLATRHFVCIGDFAQLPPIVQSSNSSVLNADIFRFCCITDAVELGYGHEWLCMLNVQRRMHPEIAEFASLRMYRGLLNSHPDMLRNRQEIVQTIPFIGHSMALADLSGMMSVCTKTLDESRINVLSAFVSMSLAISAARNHDVGIITPYHAQSRLLYTLAKDVMTAYPQLHNITCATVHQFQGSEQDIIIYDAVDCYRMKYPGMLLTSMQNDYANRLFNVALSRAKGKFITVANEEYLKNKGLSQKLMFRNLLDELTPSSATCKSGNLLYREATNDIIQWFETGKGDSVYLADLETAKKEIRIDIPSSISANTTFSKQLAQLLANAKARGLKVFVRVVDKMDLIPELRKYAITVKFITNPITLIDTSIVWFGEPASSAQFISEGKIVPTKYRPVIRFEGKKSASALFGFLSMDRVLDEGTCSEEEVEDFSNFSSFVTGTMKCPQCGKALRLKKGKKHFIGCSGYPNCEYTSYVQPEMLESYFYHNNISGKKCPNDGTSLVAEVGKFGLYIHCCGIQRHTFKLDDL